ncbi:hypothetical protein [Sphingomonas faeni]|jgi:hypothetical protein|uniref:hypothetical protein n=1 Tax=Sphingomonas faeni TaxID=185950 RepID=UPI002786E72A|nr:hypothetical protein [Sphingomonas faeni]MDQ0840234.1 hypothetical protein [Sphingomonas faeni]
MMKLHATVGFEDERLTQFRVVFPDDRVERDLHILGHAQVASLAAFKQLPTVEMLFDRPTNQVRRRALQFGCFCLYTGTQITGYPKGIRA